MQTILKHLPPIRQLPDHSSDERIASAKIIPIGSFTSIEIPNYQLKKLITFIIHSMDVERIYLVGTFSCFPEVLVEEHYLLILISEQECQNIVQLENTVNGLRHNIPPVSASIFRTSRVDEMISEGNQFFINACTADKLIYEKRNEPAPAAA